MVCTTRAVLILEQNRDGHPLTVREILQSIAVLTEGYGHGHVPGQPLQLVLHGRRGWYILLSVVHRTETLATGLHVSNESPLVGIFKGELA